MDIIGTPDVVTLRVEFRAPMRLLDAAGDKYPDDTMSDLVLRGLSCLAEVEQPPVKAGRHERKDTQ